MRYPPIEDVTHAGFSAKCSSEAAQCLLSQLTRNARWRQPSTFHNGRQCLEMSSLTGFPCVPGRETGRTSAGQNQNSSINPRYLNIYPAIHIYPLAAAAFWVEKRDVFWEETGVCAVYPTRPTQIYPKLSGFAITHINCSLRLTKNH